MKKTKVAVLGVALLTSDADLSGASHLDYVGEPMLGNVRASGSSTLSMK